MTSTSTPATPGDAQHTDQTSSPPRKYRYASERGDFAIFEPPKLDPFTDESAAEVAKAFDYSGLVGDDHNESQVKEAVEEMLRATAPGNIISYPFAQGGANGMSLVHAWFGPDFPLYRHSHPGLGDCLYYVLAGSVVLGRRVLEPGAGFFVPKDMPYKFRAGPEGVEILEFRAGGGDGPVLKLQESSVESLERITQKARALHPKWQEPPARAGDTKRPGS